MKMTGKSIAIIISSLFLTACEGPFSGATRDLGIDGKSLMDLQAGIWVDPNGCEHWIIDDGIEGYLSQRLQPNGKPVCSSMAERMAVQGDFKRGSAIPDVF